MDINRLKSKKKIKVWTNEILKRSAFWVHTSLSDLGKTVIGTLQFCNVTITLVKHYYIVSVFELLKGNSEHKLIWLLSKHRKQSGFYTSNKSFHRLNFFPESNISEFWSLSESFWSCGRDILCSPCYLNKTVCNTQLTFIGLEQGG